MHVSWISEIWISATQITNGETLISTDETVIGSPQGLRLSHLDLSDEEAALMASTDNVRP